MLQVYNRVLSSHSLETLTVLTLIALTALLAMAALEAVRSRLLIVVGTWMNARLSPVLLAASVEQAAAAPGQANARALRDLEQVRNFFTGSSIFPILDAPWAPIFFVAIFLMHPWLGWLALGGGVVLFALALLNEAVTRAPDGRGRRHAGQGLCPGRGGDPQRGSRPGHGHAEAAAPALEGAAGSGQRRTGHCQQPFRHDRGHRALPAARRCRSGCSASAPIWCCARRPRPA